MKTTVLVTGANGQLGRCIHGLQPHFPELDLVLADASVIDITNTSQVAAFFKSHKLDWCINCAAYTAVDKAESDNDQAFLVNAIGAKNLAEACKMHGVKLIHVSTDFVFDGQSKTPYTETDATHPLGIYGASKLKGEQAITSILKTYYIVRTSWLYSAYNHNFLKTMLRLAKEKSRLHVVNDQIGTPTHAEDLAHALLEMVQQDKQHYGMYHYSNTGSISWYDFARAIFELKGIATKVVPIPTSGYPTPAARPKYSVLNTKKIETTFGLKTHHWKTSLKTAILRLDMQEQLQTAIQATLEAGKVIMEVYDTAFDVELKDDKSPLTEADTKANAVINSFLIPTQIPIISEENKQTDYAVRKTWDSCWVVDPVDGTKEFIKRNGEFTVNIALVKQGQPILGVIYVPATKTLYYADVATKTAYKSILESHDTALKTVFEKAEKLQPKKDGANPVQVVGSRSHMNQDTLDFVESLKAEGKAVEIVSKGSSLKFCLVAEGNADVYPRYAPTMEWDTAAGHAICNAVGLQVISKATNKPLEYNKEDLLNPYFLVSR